AAGNKAVDDGGAGVGIALGVLFVESDAILTEGLHQSILEALGGGVQRLVGLLLTDTDGISTGRGALRRRGGRRCFRRSVRRLRGGIGAAAARGQAECHTG